MNDKKRPIEERIAQLFGGTTYRDPRDGFGGTQRAGLTAQDVAAAVGWVVREQGKVAGQVLETRYGSTLLHLQPLRRAWEDSERRPGDTRERIVLTRFAGELAIREFAGLRYSTPQLAEYAYLIYSRRESLQARMADALRWLGDIEARAHGALKARLQEHEKAA